MGRDERDEPDGGHAGLLGRRSLLGGVMAGGALALVGPGALRQIAAAVPRDAVLADPVETASGPPLPRIITRAEWGADESLRSGSRSFATLRKAFVHHTDITSVPDPAAHMRAVYRFHTQGRGWSDIGYNFGVDAAGRIYEGRWARAYASGEPHMGEDAAGRGVIGAHAGGFNTGSFGIALLGDFHGEGTSPTDAARRAMADLIAWKFARGDLDPHGSEPYAKPDGSGTVTFPNIAGHRDVGQTSCPGSDMYPLLPDLRNRVADRLIRGLVGYRVLGSDGSFSTFGRTTTFGRTADIGDLPRSGIRGRPVGGATGTASGFGAWVVGPDGGIYSFGDASFFGSMGGTRLNEPIVGMATTVSGNGYWMVARDGGIFSFGDARFLGSTGNLTLNKPIVGMAPTPSGRGYWMVASDGGIFSFGDARFFGSTGNIALVQPIVGMAGSPSGLGYWLVARDGGVFAFGVAPFLGNPIGRPGFAGPARSIAATPSGQGYWILDSAGGVHAFGDAPDFGGGIVPGARPAVDLVPIVRP